jgi:hypothetical protein
MQILSTPQVKPTFSTVRMLWRRADLQFRTCDEGLLVYDEKGGRTSLLNPQCARLLRTLCAERGVEESVAFDSVKMDGGTGFADFQALVSSLRCSGLISG